MNPTGPTKDCYSMGAVLNASRWIHIDLELQGVFSLPVNPCSVPCGLGLRV